jgi:hypothetical protein
MSALPSFLLNLTRPLAQVGLSDWLARGLVALRAVGPYAAIEIILPGGTLLALLLWMYRRHRRVQPKAFTQHLQHVS